MRSLRVLGMALIFAAVSSIALFVRAVQADTSQENACWGQATQVFAHSDVGELGDHSSSLDTPRLGLANLAKALFGEDGTMQDLGASVTDALGLEIDACM